GWADDGAVNEAAAPGADDRADFAGMAWGNGIGVDIDALETAGGNLSGQFGRAVGWTDADHQGAAVAQRCQGGQLGQPGPLGSGPGCRAAPRGRPIHPVAPDG